MPKKSKIITKEESQKIKEKHILSQDEVNTLEQMLERDEGKMDTSEIREILRESKMEKVSPSLEKVNLPQRIPTRLEGNIVNTPASNNNPMEDEDSFKYISGEPKNGEAKYVQYEGKIIDNMISRREIDNLRIEDQFGRRTATFENPQQIENSEKNNLEKYSPVSKIDKEKNLKINPFERREIKYTPEKY